MEKYAKKKMPLTKIAIEELQGKIKKDPTLMKRFVRDFKKGLASQGYFVTEEFRTKLVREAEDDMKNAMRKIPASDKKLNMKIEKGKTIKVSVRIDREKGTRTIKIR